MALTGPKFVRTHVRQTAGYVPGEQPSAGERVVKLNTNENPFPPGPKVMQALREIDPEMLRRYPNPTADGFRTAAAKVLGVEPDMIMAGNGSDEVLTIAMRTFIGQGGTLAYPDPTYSLFKVLTELDDAEAATVPWNDDWSLPAEALLATKPNAIFIANPNAPSGTLIAPSEISKLADDFSGLVLVDEAYVDFADENCIPLVLKHENVIVTRTLSKAYSLAGLRFGFCIGQPQVIFEMNKVRDSYNVDAIAAVLSTAAIEDQEYARGTWEHVRAERRRVSDELIAMGWDVLPSHTNFILATVPGGRGREAYDGLRRQGIIVRHFNSPGLNDKLRITIGTSQENNALLGGIKELSIHEKAA